MNSLRTFGLSWLKPNPQGEGQSFWLLKFPKPWVSPTLVRKKERNHNEQFLASRWCIDYICSTTSKKWFLFGGEWASPRHISLYWLPSVRLKRILIKKEDGCTYLGAWKLEGIGLPPHELIRVTQDVFTQVRVCAMYTMYCTRGSQRGLIMNRCLGDAKIYRIQACVPPKKVPRIGISWGKKSLWQKNINRKPLRLFFVMPTQVEKSNRSNSSCLCVIIFNIKCHSFMFDIKIWAQSIVIAIVALKWSHK